MASRLLLVLVTIVVVCRNSSSYTQQCRSRNLVSALSVSQNKYDDPIQTAILDIFPKGRRCPGDQNLSVRHLMEVEFPPDKSTWNTVNIITLLQRCAKFKVFLVDAQVVSLASALKRRTDKFKPIGIGNALYGLLCLGGAGVSVSTRNGLLDVLQAKVHECKQELAECARDWQRSVRSPRYEQCLAMRRCEGY